MAAPRRLLIAVDDTDDDEAALNWAMENIVRSTDEVHICHVVPRLSYALQYGAILDTVPQPEDARAYDERLRQAEAFITRRFLPMFEGHLTEPIVHLIKSETDNDAIGRVVCQKVQDLLPAAVLLAKHTRGRLHDFFMGSVCKYCVQHSTQPVIVYR